MENERILGYKQRFNPFRFEFEIDYLRDTYEKLNRRLGFDGALLLDTIESHQQS
jgi:hypothetical protein